MQKVDLKQEFAELIAETLRGYGYEAWITVGSNGVRTNATIAQARAVLSDEYGYPAHLIGWNTSYSRGMLGDYKVIVKVF